jgi:hypothetical protein
MYGKVRWLVAPALVAGLVGCSGGDNGATTTEQTSRDSTYAKLVAAEPAHAMSYSPSRATINFWIDTWGKDPNKLSYVYLQNADGKLLGYYVLKGLPVSYCAGLTPPYQWVDIPGDGGDTKEQAPAPGVDGVYYSGGQCMSYFGRDATTNAYIEYTAGLGINVLLYDQPLPNNPNVAPLGPTSVDDVKGAG